MAFYVNNFNSKGKKVKPSSIILKEQIIYEILRKYLKTE